MSQEVRDLTIYVSHNWRVDSDIQGGIVITFKKSESGPYVPYQCEYTKLRTKVGAKLSVEVVENGYLVTHGKRKLISQSQYDFENLIRAELEELVTLTNPFDDENWPASEYDFTSSIIEINAKYKQLEAQ